MGLHIVQWAVYAIVLAVIAYITGTKYLKYQKSGDEISDSEWMSLGGQVLLLAVIGIVIVQSFTYVQQGYACVVIDPLLDSKSMTLGEKFFFRFPWTRTVHIYYATLSTEMWTDNDVLQQIKDGVLDPNTRYTGEYSAVKVLSQDGLDIEVDVLIRYELDPTKIIKLYESYPDLRYEDKAVSSVTREDVRDVISGYTTLEIVEERATISDSMAQTILTSLSNEPSLHGALTNIQIDLRDIDPPQSFKIAVQAKKTAEQAKLQAVHAREQKLIEADAIAQESVRLSQGEAEAIMIRANATKSAMALISGELDTEVYYSLQMLKEIAPNIKYLFLNAGGDDGVPLYFQVPTETP